MSDYYVDHIGIEFLKDDVRKLIRILKAVRDGKKITPSNRMLRFIYETLDILESPPKVLVNGFPRDAKWR